MLFETQLTFVYRLSCSSLWFEVSTLAYETNKNCWPERFSVPYYTCILQTNLMLKIRDIHKNWCLKLQEGPQTCLL